MMMNTSEHMEERYPSFIELYPIEGYPVHFCLVIESATEKTQNVK